MTTKLVFLVEYGTDDNIERRHLFETDEEAKNFCKKELYLECDPKKTYLWQAKNRSESAKIITLVLKEKNDKLKPKIDIDKETYCTLTNFINSFDKMKKHIEELKLLLKK